MLTKKNYPATFALFFALPLLFLSCEKEPGEGGTSSISGKVFTQNINSDGEIVGEYYAQDQDVYIIYGSEDETYNDKFSTSLDGSFRFDYLTPGEYTLFTYSECDACMSGIEAKKQTVTIEGNKEEIVLPDFIIFD